MSTRFRFAVLLVFAGALAGCGDQPALEGPAALVAPQIREIPPEPASSNAHAMFFGGLNGRVEIPYSMAYKNPKFTVELWVNPRGINPGFMPLLASQNTNEWNTADGFSLKFESERAYLRAAKASNLAAGYYAPYVPTAGRWTHLAGTYDGAVARLYIDGELRVETPDDRQVWYGTKGLTLGLGYHSMFGGQKSFFGRMDELRIWNYARSADEIRSTMEAELVGDEPGLVGYWDFEKPDGAIVKDMSPSRVDGLLIGTGMQYVPSTPF